jgi:hypothetical protein
LTAQESGQGNQRIPDVAILSFAFKLRRAVLTYNRLDFKRLHRTVQPHAGIIVCTPDDDDSVAARIDLAIRVTGMLDNKLLVINKPPGLRQSRVSRVHREYSCFRSSPNYPLAAARLSLYADSVGFFILELLARGDPSETLSYPGFFFDLPRFGRGGGERC